MSGEIHIPRPDHPPAEKIRKRLRQARWIRANRSWLRYIASLLLVAAVTFAGSLLLHHIDPTNLAMLYLIVVILAGVYLGRGATIFASVLSTLAFDYFLVEPRFTMTVADTQYLITLGGLLAVGLVVSYSVALVRDQLEKLRLRDVETTAINALSYDLTAAQNQTEMLTAVLKHLSSALSRNGVILLADKKRVSLKAATPGFQLTNAELGLAQWCFENGRPVGRGTDFHADARVRFIPLQSAKERLGVLGVTPTGVDTVLTREQSQLLDGFAGLTALGIERARLVEQAGRADMMQATERLQTALLNSVSHDLRTPLAAIAGVLSTLKEFESNPDQMGLDRDTRLELLDTAWDEVERLNRFVGNLLEMTRLESGALYLHEDLVEVQDLIGTVAQSMGERLKSHHLALNISPNLPPIRIDFLLFSQVLINLLDNAAKYSPPNSIIEVAASKLDSEVEIKVLDRGVGILPEDLSRVFDKFYRVQRPTGVSGTGLGLAISKGIVEAHNGSIRAENREGGGTTLIIKLPIEPGEAQ